MSELVMSEKMAENLQLFQVIADKVYPIDLARYNDLLKKSGSDLTIVFGYCNKERNEICYIEGNDIVLTLTPGVLSGLLALTNVTEKTTGDKP